MRRKSRACAACDGQQEATNCARRRDSSEIPQHGSACCASHIEHEQPHSTGTRPHGGHVLENKEGFLKKEGGVSLKKEGLGQALEIRAISLFGS